jgi:hypothetical protein
MSEIPSVLVVDDGQLDRVFRILEELGAAPERMRASKIRSSLEKPRDLLVMSWHPSRELPALHDNAEGAEPTRVCFHSQDFLPLRERMRDLGVDYLVQSALDNASLRVFLQSQLYRGPERRANLRLPLGGAAMLHIRGEKERVRLADLSLAVATVESPREIGADEAVSVVLPKGLGGERPLEIPGRAMRSNAVESRGSQPSFSTVIRFEEISEEVRAQLEKIVGGEQIGTRATPLQPVEPVQPAAEDPERRLEPRTRYERKVALLDRVAASPALGRDLSTSGVCLTGAPPLPKGSNLTIALYGDERGEPVVVDATVVRVDGEELGLSLATLRDDHRTGIERLLSGSTMVESLSGGSGAERRIATRVIPLPS